MNYILMPWILKEYFIFLKTEESIDVYLSTICSKLQISIQQRLKDIPVERTSLHKGQVLLQITCPLLNPERWGPRRSSNRLVIFVFIMATTLSKLAMLFLK